MPSLHWLSTSIQEFKWNSKSWPDGIPKNRVGRNRAKAVTAMVRMGKPRSGLPGGEGVVIAVSGGRFGTEEIVA
jgi:hypothetical protein